MKWTKIVKAEEMDKSDFDSKVYNALAMVMTNYELKGIKVEKEELEKAFNNFLNKYYDYNSEDYEG